MHSPVYSLESKKFTLNPNVVARERLNSNYSLTLIPHTVSFVGHGNPQTLIRLLLSRYTNIASTILFVYFGYRLLKDASTMSAGELTLHVYTCSYFQDIILGNKSRKIGIEKTH